MVKYFLNHRIVNYKLAVAILGLAVLSPLSAQKSSTPKAKKKPVTDRKSVV